MSESVGKFRAIMLTSITVALIIVGAVLYLNDSIGWAQAAWVVASGASGASIVLWIEQYW